MTICQSSEYVLSHPFTKRAIENFLEGNVKDLKFIFDLLQIDVYQETSKECTKAFKRNKEQNYPLVEEAIREVAPPDRLNIKLPIPLPKPKCIVVPMKVKKSRVKAIMVIVKIQLELDFTQKSNLENIKIAL